MTDPAIGSVVTLPNIPEMMTIIDVTGINAKVAWWSDHAGTMLTANVDTRALRFVRQEAVAEGMVHTIAELASGSGRLAVVPTDEDGWLTVWWFVQGLVGPQSLRVRKEALKPMS